MRNLTFVMLAFCIGFVSCERREMLKVEKAEAKSYSMMAPPAIMKDVKRVKFEDREIIERKLIKNGEITFSTKDVNETRKELEKVCKEFNGYISSEEQQKLNNAINYYQVIRIPAARFDTFMKVVEGLGEHVEHRTLTTQDVTEEFIDVEARLKTKKELEIRYHQLLGKATKIEDMLSIEAQISQVRTEIESMQGRLQYLTNRVGYSTLTVNYHQTVVSADPPGYGSRLISSFVTGWNGLLIFLIGVVTAWPFILIVTVGIWLITRWIKKLRHTPSQVHS